MKYKYIRNKEKWETPGDIQSYLTELTEENDEIDVVKVMRNLRQFADTLQADRRKFFQMYFLQHRSVQEIFIIEEYGTLQEAIVCLREIKKSLRKWIETECLED